MPELPEVETIGRALHLQLVGARILQVEVRQPRLRRLVDIEALVAGCVDRRIEAVRRRGKYLVVELNRQRCLVLHLGMTGSFRIEPAGAPTLPHDHVVWELDDGRCWIFHDPRRFGCVVPASLSLDDTGRRGPLPELGPEPLSDGFTVEDFHRRLSRRQAPIKNVLLDQRVVAGIGNIYASEALFMAGINPRRRAARIGRDSCRRLHRALREVLTEAIACGGTTISDYRSVDGLRGRFAVHLQVYGKPGENCPRCGAVAKIRVLPMAGRSTFYCPRCQH